MPKSTVQDEDAYPLPEDTLFDARLDSVELRTVVFEYKAHHKSVQSGKNTVGEKGEIRRWKWTFAILSPDQYVGLKVEGETEPKISMAAGDQARNWYETLLDTQVGLGDDIDTDLALGLPCQLTVRHEDPRPRREGGMFYACAVDDVFPPTSRPARAMAATSDEPPF